MPNEAASTAKASEPKPIQPAPQKAKYAAGSSPAGAGNQTPVPAGKPLPERNAATASQGPLTWGSFHSLGLSDRDLFVLIYRGQFDQIRNKPDALGMSMLLEGYLKDFATRCAAELPPNKVEMTKQVCAREQFPVNRYGMRTGASTCIEYREEGMNLFAAPEMNEAKLALGREVDVSAGQKLFSILSKPDAASAPMNMLSDFQVVQNDIDVVFEKNECASPGLKHFQENLRRLVMKEQPLPVTERGPDSATAVATRPFRAAQYAKLADDLVSAQSKMWAFNRYSAGSAGNVAVSAWDAEGYPVRMIARYSYIGMGGLAAGSVIIQFTDQKPSCLYFFDNPGSCRSASSAIASAYAEGRYDR